MGLQQRAGDWQGKMLKAVIFFAVLGCIILSAAVYLLNKTMSELTSAFPSQPTTTTTTATSGTR